MGDTVLQERLHETSMAFDGLLSLIPAKLYYGNGDEPSEQWQKKKKTKEEKKAARLANLDPENSLNKSVKELIDEEAARNSTSKPQQPKIKNNKKRTAEAVEAEEQDEQGDAEEDDDSDDASLEGIVKETPGEGLKRKQVKDRAEKPSKKQKLSESGASASKPEPASNPQADSEDEEDAEEQGISLEDAKLSKHQEKRLLAKMKKAEKKAEKKKRKADKKANKADSRPEKKADKDDEDKEDNDDSDDSEEEDDDIKVAAAKPIIKSKEVAEEDDDNISDEQEDNGNDKDVELQPGLDFSALADEQDVMDTSNDNNDNDASSSPSSPASPTFDTPADAEKTAESGSTTTVESVPVSHDDKTTSSEPTKKHAALVIPADMSALRARLAARITALRAARNADGEDGKPTQSRHELMETRRQKQAEQKKRRREQWRAAKLEEERKREEAIASARGSPMVGTPVRDGGSSPVMPNHFSFGRVTFADGAEMSNDLSSVKGDGSKTKRGPAANDVKAQLAKLEAQKKRLANMDEATRKDIEEKERWLAARKRASGVGRGDGGGLTAAAAASGALSVDGSKGKSVETMLKKAIKRKEKAKKKSEKEWTERKSATEYAGQRRQQKREDNLRKRKEDKMLHKAGLLKKKKGGAGGGGGKGGGKKKGRPGFEGSFGGRK